MVTDRSYSLQYDLKNSPKVKALTEQAIARFREHEPPEGYYLAFSGGKDSIVIYDNRRGEWDWYCRQHSPTGIKCNNVAVLWERCYRVREYFARKEAMQ